MSYTTLSTGRSLKFDDVVMYEEWEVDDGTEFDQKGVPVDGYATWIRMSVRGGAIFEVRFLGSFDQFEDVVADAADRYVVSSEKAELTALRKKIEDLNQPLIVHHGRG